MSYIKKEPLLQIAKELQGNDAFGAPLIVRAIEEPLRMEPITKAPNASDIPALMVITTIRKHNPRETTIRVSPVRKFFIFLKIVGMK